MAGSGAVAAPQTGTDLVDTGLRRAPWIALLLIALAAAGGIGIWMVKRGGDQGADRPAELAAAAFDAAPLAGQSTPTDGGAVGSDAGTTVATIDGPTSTVEPTSRTPGKRPRAIDAGATGPGAQLLGSIDAGSIARPSGRPDAGSRPLGPDVSVQILTEPRGGRLYVGGLDSGPDGTNFSRPAGTRLTVGCRLVDRKGKLLRAGSLRVEFDADERVVVCKMKKPSDKCVDGIKDPFKGCE